MKDSSSPCNALLGLQYHLCKAIVPAEAVYVCDKCLGPLEPLYDYASIKVTREDIERRPKNLWRYRELLPITGEPRTGFNSGYTPLVRCDRLAKRLGVTELYIKDDSVNHPTLSYKDRVVSIAASAQSKLGFQVPACSSTRQPREQRVGARGAARHGVLRLHSRQPRAGQGVRVGHLSSDDSRHRRQLRRCEPAVHAGGGSLRLGIRQHQPPRVLRRGREDDGSKSPSSWAGASRATSCRRSPAGRCCRASFAGSASSATSAWSTATCRASTRRRRRVRAGHQRARKRARASPARAARTPSPSRSPSAILPTTHQVLEARGAGRVGRRRHRSEIIDAIQLLAETEGIFTEPAGGTTLAAAVDLIRRGVIPRTNRSSSA